MVKEPVIESQRTVTYRPSTMCSRGTTRRCNYFAPIYSTGKTFLPRKGLGTICRKQSTGVYGGSMVDQIK
jgi:hypothetical protein